MSSLGTQGAQRSQARSQTRVFTMTASEAQANPDNVSGIMIVFGTPTQVLFYSGSSRSFVSSSFVLHADRELSSLKHKLVVTTLLEEQIIRNSIFKGYEILIEGVMLKANLILLEMWDFAFILGMDWLSTHREIGRAHV